MSTTAEATVRAAMTTGRMAVGLTVCAQWGWVGGAPKPPSDTPWGSAESPHSAAVEAKLQEGM